MKAAHGGMNVSILGKEFMVACPENERESLTAAARYLDEKMREIQDSGKVLGSERCAIMAALNIASELLELRASDAPLAPEVNDKLKRLQDKIDAVLQDEVMNDS